MIKSAVITGGHHFDVMAFHQLFRDLPGVDAYPQHMADFIISPLDSRANYDVLVFYTHLKDELTPIGSAPGRDDSIQAMLQSLATTSQGIVILHHSLLAFPGWGIWNDIVGMSDRTLAQYVHDETIQVQVADPHHPITAGLSNWSIVDETYLMPNAAEEEGNHILLTTQHHHNMTTLAWTRQVKNSRVCCLQLGHDAQAWGNAHFRQLLAQAISWCAKPSDINGG
jgi:uncharacterized protein